MTQEKLARINQLARKQKESGLSETEKQEQQELRNEYIEEYRKSFMGILDNTYIKYPDGKKEKLKKKEK